jgi:hypothetical protein
MEHLQQFGVEFISVIPRSFDGQNYFRNNFVIEEKVYSVSSPLDLSGLDGTVMFIKKGELSPDGKVVVNDAFSLVGVTTLTALETANRKKFLKNELKKKDE